MLSQIFIELSNTRNPTFITFRSVRWYVHTGQYMSSLILFFPVFIEYLINIFSFSVFILYQYEQKFNPLMHNVPKWSACSKWLGMCGHFLWIAPYKKIKGVWSWFYSSGGSKKLWAELSYILAEVFNVSEGVLFSRFLDGLTFDLCV